MGSWYRPEATVKEALTSISWPIAIGLFILPPTLVGAQDGLETAVLGFTFGFGFVCFMLVLQWWWGPI